MLIDQNLITKYNIRGPRYTSYPTANEFHERVTGDDFRSHLISSNQNGPANISLYFHIPFCPRLCHFCGCHTHLSTRDELHRKYTDALLHEISVVFSHLDLSRPVTQIHWGGGTPNAISFSLIKKVMDFVTGRVRLAPEAEIAMECNPAYLTPESVSELAAMGFNRISLGIQDFNEKVLLAVNREPSKLPVDELVSLLRQAGIGGINLDFIYGLPLQTLDSFLETIEKAITLKPERLVTFSYAHVPWVKKGQTLLEPLGFPDETLKMSMLERSAALLRESGYTMIGIDHYALPHDSLAIAKAERTLHRNFQGYCTRNTTGQVYAFGASAITQLESAYFQNIKETNAYMESVVTNDHAVQRGYLLNTEERIIRSSITEIMCNGRLSFSELAHWHHSTEDHIRSVLRVKADTFAGMEQDGLVVTGPDEVRITPSGEFLARVVAMKLDPRERDQAQYSKTI
jgi:oxygen-independent coproporphyrinogen III oxidase